MDPLTYDNLMVQEQAIYHQVERDASGRDLQQVLHEHPGDLYHKARVAQVLSGDVNAGEALMHMAYRERLDELAADPTKPINDDPKVVRRFDDGRTAVQVAWDPWSGQSLLEYADGSREMVPACDTGHVGPDPDVMARAEQLRDQAANAERWAEQGEDAVGWQGEAERLHQAADACESRAFDWMKNDMHDELDALVRAEYADEADEA